MTKGLRFKIVRLFISLIVVSFLVISLLIYMLLGRYYTEREGSMLEGTASRIAVLTVEMRTVESEYANIFKRLFQINLDSFHQNSGADIVVINADEEILALSTSANFLFSENPLPKHMLETVLRGQSIKLLSEVGGIYNSSAVVVGQPIEYQGEIIGGVFCLLPTPYVDELRYDVLKLILAAMVITFLVASILSILFAKTIASPIKQISKAAKAISGGDFQQRLSITTKDEIGELAQNFNHMAESLQNLEDMRSSFIANVSHELRTPMTIILGFLDGILDGTIPPQQHAEYLTIVINEVKRLSRLVSDLLDLARIESGSKPLNLVNYNINEQIRLSILRFENKINEKDIHVEVEFSQEEIIVEADGDAIERVITNLIDNAVKFINPHGTLKLSVETKNNFAYISVQNTGDGIPENELKYIWDRFYKTDKSRRNKTGAGLGLYIVKNLIKQHGGNIWAESVVGEYTRFIFTLKLA